MNVGWEVLVLILEQFFLCQSMTYVQTYGTLSKSLRIKIVA